MTHRGQPRESFAELRKSPRERYADWRGDLPLPEHLVSKRRPLDPVRGAVLMLVLPFSALAAAVSPDGWPWWQRVLAFLAALVLSVYPTLLIIGYWRLWRHRTSGGPS
ncbi:hypothetical protein SCOCK_580050 [Actinacidiphila cocklensis]|uniref:Uncharacterized protein n=1 Tax=Actinacidiphila cocklensis TaxID=887465 RepID=A0A9W4E202_9ACTN|nr:hypothetical protein SCOCK_580050 [Actinacidiphila cocklensis]